MSYSEKVVDVICQHTRDFKIIPMRVRIQDEDGEFHVYNIKSYKDTSPIGAYKLPNGMVVSKGIWSFDCKILVFNTLKNIRLFYNPSDNKWSIIQ